MDTLFSCRNCVHNCGQSLIIGKGSGYCIKHDSVLYKPSRYTCKYLHRKDLPRFVVDEGVREHAAEFAGFSGIVDLVDLKPVRRLHYSEKFAWEHGTFDSITQSLAQYHKTKPAWVFLQAMAGGIDGRRALTHASLVRRYMDNCGSWTSSYRFALVIVEELANTPKFSNFEFSEEAGEPDEELLSEAVWDVFFTRISGVQEYGFHSGIESLMWATDQLNESLSSFNWDDLQRELQEKSAEWREQIIRHATDEGEFFAHPEDFESE